MKARGDSWAAYWLWCLAGAGLCLGVLSILTIGPFVLLVTLGLCGVAAVAGRLRLGDARAAVGCGASPCCTSRG